MQGASVMIAGVDNDESEASGEGYVAGDLTSDYDAARDAIPLAAEIVTIVSGLPVLAVSPLVGLGSVNLILLVQTSRNEIVVRLNRPGDNPANARRSYEKERWCIGKATEAGIPGPEVTAIGEHSGRAFMLQPRIPGLNGSQSGVPPEELLRILGTYARRIHAIPTHGFGDSVEAFETGSAREDWLRFIDYNLGELTAQDPLIGLGVYKPSQQSGIKEAFTWLRGLALTIGLNHCDLARRNTIVEGDLRADGRVHLLDWGCAEMQVVPHLDLHNLLRWFPTDHPRLHAFLEGYGITKEAWKSLLPEISVFVMLKSFDLTRWALARCPERIGELSARATRNLTFLP